MRWFLNENIRSDLSPSLSLSLALPCACVPSLPCVPSRRQQEWSLKSEMLSLARTSKYVNNTSVLSINKTEEDSLDWKDSSNSIVSVLINSYSCFLIDEIVPTRNQL